MSRDLLHTPDGVRDVYDNEYRHLKYIRNKLNETIKTFGYASIDTPTFEFFDIFSKEVGTTPSRELYKFFDKEGNTLVLRPDFTPSIARAAAKYYMEDSNPVRLCYEGKVFCNNDSFQGRLKESTQIGAELIGLSGADADAEIIAMVVKSLLATGLTDFQISIGHSGIYKSLVNMAGLDEEAAEELSLLISNKNVFGAEEFLDSHKVSAETKELFQLCTAMYQEPGEWSRLTKSTGDTGEINDALKSLEDLYEILKIYGIDGYVSFEPGIISRHDYYTGIIFGAYTYGTGEAVVSGGRYDKLMSYFGKNTPAIGFSIVCDRLMFAMSAQKLLKVKDKKRETITYGDTNRSKAIKQATELREQGIPVTLIYTGK